MSSQPVFPGHGHLRGGWGSVEAQGCWPYLSPAGRVQAELDRVLGPGRLPRLEDQQSLPYTNAVLHEVQRFITLLPHVPRCVAADTQLGGYLLPKVGTHLPDPDGWARPSLPLPSLLLSTLGQGGPSWESGGPGWPPGGTLSLSAHPCLEGCGPRPPAACPQGTPVIPLLSSVLLDKTQWETPRQFNPGHFLDAEGRFVKRAAFLPFSAGTHSPHRWGHHGAPHPKGPRKLRVKPAGPPAAHSLSAPRAGRVLVTADLALRSPPLQPSLVLPELPLSLRSRKLAGLPGTALRRAGLEPPPCASVSSAGRRVCVGESLARSELFLLFAGLLHRYRLLPPPGLSPTALDTTPAPAFTMRPPAQALCVVPRPGGSYPGDQL